MIINFINTHLVYLGQASTVSHLKKEEAHKVLVKMQGKTQMRHCLFLISVFAIHTGVLNT